ncbi:MAG: hypothetical protein N3D82_05025 [Ignisphaera sp.]|nr:hypothetical protein [Ignisphaera sp.]MCX8168370.1 hypothetical protein [Ignisphaera sp.]MDW8086181.1 hypothetical protein [Ignisphaera sp.]
MVLVRLHGVIKEEGGIGVVNVDAKSVSEVLHKLPSRIKDIVGKYIKYVVIVVDGEILHVNSEKYLEGDEAVDIFLVAGGG